MGFTRLYHSTTFAGFIGAHTVSYPGKFSLSIDSRFDSNIDLGLIEWLRLDSNDKSAEITMACREVIETAADYDAALAKLSLSKMIGPGCVM